MLTLDDQIIYQLLLRSSNGKDIGLLHGKMGLILFFVHFHKHTNCQIYNNTADELMDELLKEIHNALPVTFSKGLSGIGWGVEYLIQNGFINDDSLEVCKEMDNKIMGCFSMMKSSNVAGLAVVQARRIRVLHCCSNRGRSFTTWRTTRKNVRADFLSSSGI